METIHETIYIIVGEVGNEPFRETWIAGYHPDKAGAESFAKTAGAYAQRMAHEYADKDLSLFDAPKDWLQRFCQYDAQLVQALDSDDPDIKGATFSNFQYRVQEVPLVSGEE